jgi:signal transduction histidine kinase
MEGFDKEWIYCGTRRFATYTNLEPGEYSFRVKGSNNDGIWNETGTRIKIIITPPFWKTWWFKSLGALSIAGVTGLTYHQKLLKMEKNKELQEEFSRRLLESQEEERKRIASDLHDTIAHEILITKNKAVLGLKKTEDSNAIKNILNEISELSSDTLKDVRNISYNLHPHQISRLGMTKAIRSVINSIANSSEIKFTCNIENIDGILSKELEINIFRIVQECSNNIIKHSGADEATLNIIKDAKTLTMTVWDNGKGISKGRIDGIGLAGIAERVKLYKGELVIESVPSNGTIIVISLPYKNLKPND